MNTFSASGRRTGTSWPKWVRTLIMTLLFLLGGGVVGLLLSFVWLSHLSSTSDARRAAKTTSLLNQMRSIAIGDTLSDAIIEDLKGSKVWPSNFVKKRTWIGVIEPGCDACDNTIQDLKSNVSPSQLESCFLFISAANPRVLQDLRDQEGVLAPILYDHRRQWLHSINLTTFPFFLLVDSTLRIQQAVAGGLSPVHAIRSIETSTKEKTHSN